MAKLAGGFDATAFPLLAGIDPYGVTIFNDLQKPRLVDELTRYVDVARPEIQEDVRQLADFVRKQIDQYRVYIWFISD